MNNIRGILDILIKLNYILNSKQKRKSVAALIATICNSIFELLGVSIVVPFLYCMVAPEKIYDNRYISVLISFLHISSEKQLLLLMGSLIIIIYIIKNIFMIFAAYVQNMYSAQIQSQLSIRMLNEYMQRDYSYFRKTNSAQILRAVQRDTAGIYAIIGALFSVVTYVMTVILIVIYLVKMDIVMSIGVMTLAIATLLLIVIAFKKKMKIMGVELRNANLTAQQYAYEAISGIKEITVSHKREYFISKYKMSVNKRQKAVFEQAFTAACPYRVIEGICVSGFVGIVCVRIMGGFSIAEFIPNLAAFALGAFKILPAVSAIASDINTIVFNKPALDATYMEIKTTANYKMSVNKYNLENRSNELITFRDKIEVIDVSWRYEDGIDYVLKGVNINIKRGEAVAFIGPSGAGKSTMADILLGLFKPQEGKILVDGNDIFAYPDQWSKIVGYVPQNVFLLDSTIRENIAFGVSDKEIDDELIWELLEQVQLRGFVEKLPNKLETIVGERGVKFSGGQRQRLAIARSLYHNPELLILDEATSALDVETEQAVMEAIESLYGVKTLIIIAHRLSTIQRCDKTYEINEKKARLVK